MKHIVCASHCIEAAQHIIKQCCLLLVILVFGATPIYADKVADGGWDVYETYHSGYAWQEVGYAGLGNPNEVLAVGEYTLQQAGKPSVQFELLGNATAAYVSRVKVWARKYDGGFGGSDFTCVSQVSNTFAYQFDYRNPSRTDAAGNPGAVLLKEIAEADFPAPGTALTITSDAELEAGRWVFYVTADVKAASALAKPLPPLRGGRNKTQLGANITMFNLTSTTTPRGAFSQASGSRVLLPGYHVVYAPGDSYSRYYRIPAIAQAQDGSLVCISDARKYHMHDVRNDIDMLARRSTDNGRTWSNPITIAKGSGGSAGMSGNCSGKTSLSGYGDAALAVLPGGKLLCTMISGAGLSESYNTRNRNNTAYQTRNFYTVSSNNGQSWSQLKEIPQSLFNYERGCVAPGSICVVKEGYLAGKAVACFRSYQTFDGSLTNWSYLLVYDPATDEWSRLQTGQSREWSWREGWHWVSHYTYPEEARSGYDEAHLAEVGENQLVMSIRTTNRVNGQYRAFADVAVTSESACEINPINAAISNGVACNGDIVNYAVGDNNFLLHTLPVGNDNDHGNTSTARTGLTVFSSPVQRDVAWTPRLNLGDPWGSTSSSTPRQGSRHETTQYSSIAQQSDGTVGIIFEEYPQVIRINNADKGDFLMRALYVDVRLSDIMPEGVDDPVIERLEPPTIDPSSTTFNLLDEGDRPRVVITRYNDALVADGSASVTVSYSMTLRNASGTVKSTVTGSFTDADKAFDWQGDIVAAFPTGTKLEKGDVLTVAASNSAPGFTQSSTAQESYTFTTPVRKVVAIARPDSYTGIIELITDASVYQSGEAVTVGTSDKITINGDLAAQYSWLGFSLTGTKYEDNIAQLGASRDNPYQITFNMPSEDKLANNYDSDGDGELDALALYLWYEVNDVGVKTRVSINYFDSRENDESIVGEGKRNYFHSDFCTQPTMSGSAFPDPNRQLDFDRYRMPRNYVDGFTYPTKAGGPTASSYYTLGLDVKVSVMPDAKSTVCNAIVLIKKSTNQGVTYSYVSGVGGAVSDDKPMYYLINGTVAPFAQGSAVYDNAAGVKQWYQAAAQARVPGLRNAPSAASLPVMVEEMDFKQVARPGETYAVGNENIAPYFIAEVYVLKDNSLQSVSQLAGDVADVPTQFLFKVSHYVEPDGTKTEVHDVEAGKQVRRIDYYNLQGMRSSHAFDGVNIVVTTYTDGTRTTVKRIK